MVHRDSLSCEAIVRKLPNGELIIVSQCGGLTEPCLDNRVYLFRSSDNGKTWSKPELIIPDHGRAMYATEVMVFNNQVKVFITEHNGNFLDYDCYVLVSNDNGYSWKREEIPCFKQSFVFIRGHIIMHDGTLLLPYQHYDFDAEEHRRLLLENKRIFDSDLKVVKNGVIISKNGGLTYTKSQAVEISNYQDNRKIWQWPEPTIIELSDNSLAMLLRVNGAGYLYRSDSFDGGFTWTEPYKTTIPNPNNKAKLLKFTDGRIALLNTPNSNIGMRYRNPLSVWISDDDMKTWKYQKDIIKFEGWLSYPDGFIADNQESIIFTFELNRHDIYFVEHVIES